MAKILVTGASGFIGSTLTDALIAQGHHVRALHHKGHLPAAGHPQLEIVQGDLRRADTLRNAVRSVDRIYHIAAVTCTYSEKIYEETNHYGTARLADACIAEGVNLDRFVYLSSLAAGGPSHDGRNKVETDSDAPVSYYGRSKLAGERALLKHRDRLPIVILRPTMVYGPRDPQYLSLLKTVKSGLVPLVPGKTPTRSKYYGIIYVDDLVKYILSAGESSLEQVPSGEVFYVCDGNRYSFEEIMETMETLLGKKALKLKVPETAANALAHLFDGVSYIARKPFPLNRDKIRDLKPDYWVCSPEKAIAQFQFRAQTPLHEGMRETIAWFKSKKML